MRFVFLSAIKDLRRLRRDPLTLATWIGTPLLLAILMVAFFGHEQPKPQGLVLISDQDKTLLSALIMHAYTQDKLGEMFTVQQVPLQEGRRRINSGDGSALVIIPKGFSKAVLGTAGSQDSAHHQPFAIHYAGYRGIRDLGPGGGSHGGLQQLVGDDLHRFSGNESANGCRHCGPEHSLQPSGYRYRKYLDPPVNQIDR